MPLSQGPSRRPIRGHSGRHEHRRIAGHDAIDAPSFASPLAGVAGRPPAASSACDARRERVAERGAAPARADDGRILLAYFSRPGENYWYGGRRNLEVGNTEVLARMIRARLDCDVHRIEAADPYPDDYDADRRAQRARAGRGRAAGDRQPAPRRSTRYDTILLASPIWNVRAPMIMTTFAERYDFAGKTVHPVTTHAMSGLGNDSRRLRAVVPGRAHRHRTRRSRREGALSSRGRRRVAASDRSPLGDGTGPSLPVSSSSSCVFPRGANAIPTTPDTISIPASTDESVRNPAC